MTDHSETKTRHVKRCDICSRGFARLEHLTRHRRIHTKEKPFACPHCPQSFQRSDVRALHLQKCHLESSPSPSEISGAGASARKRVRIACDNCRKRKMRCDGQKLCAQCRMTASVCEYASTSSRGATDEPIENIPSENRISSQPFESPLDGTSNPRRSMDAPVYSAAQVHIDPNMFQAAAFGAQDTTESSLFTVGTDELVSMQVASDNAANDIGLSILSGSVPYPFLDPDTLNDIWQLPAMNTPFWFDGSDIGWHQGRSDANSFMADHTIPSSLQSMTRIMQEHFERRSQPPSPTLNPARAMWYSARPNLEDYDRDIVSVFLSLFYKHIPSTFPIFDEKSISDKPRAEFYLAQAATGGLFCTVPGSAEVAKSMYNDARRLLYESVKTRHSDHLLHHRSMLDDVKTCIALELYGLCSGDKRSYEFVEAFHGELLQAVQEYSFASRKLAFTLEKDNDNARLLDSLFVLDCYRVIIMQRPPSLFWSHPLSFAVQNPPESQVSQLYDIVTKLTDSTPTITPVACKKYNFFGLAALSVYLWPTIYRRWSGYRTDTFGIENPSNWKRDFVDLACNTWLRTMGQVANPSTLAVYHLMNIMLHANIVALQNFAHSPHDSSLRDPEKSLTCKEIYSWIRGRDYGIANWHASMLINSIEGLTSHHSITTAQITDSECLSPETPHVPYAIYYASLVLWCGAITEDTRYGRTSAQAHLEKGGQLLSSHKVHIAQRLALVLKEIK